MKHNYKIRVDEPLPSDEQISQHKSFDRLLADYHNLTQPIYRRPLYKNPRAFIGLVLILTLGFLVFEAVEEDKDKIAEREIPASIREAEQNAFLSPVRPGLTVAWESREVSPVSPQKVKLENGLEVEIPKEAFVFADGSPVADAQVLLSIRLIKDPFEIAVSGIPMHALEDGNKVQLESDILLDIKAEVDGNPVRLKKGSKLTVLLPASETPPAQDLRLHQLDTAERTWVSLDPGYQVMERKAPQGKLFAHLPGSDGMNMVEFDSEGKPLVSDTHYTAKDSASATLLYQRRLEIESLGLFGLDRRIPEPESGTLRRVKVRLQNQANLPVPTYALYKVISGLNTVAYFWPQDKEFSYELSFLPGRDQTFFGFTEDGRLITLTAANLDALAARKEAQTIQVKISDGPVKNIPELRQLLSFNPGQ